MTHLTDTADLWMPGKPSRLHLSLAVDADLTGRETDAVREAASEAFMRSLTGDDRPLDENDADLTAIARRYDVAPARLAHLVTATTTTETAPPPTRPEAPSPSPLRLVRAL